MDSRPAVLGRHGRAETARREASAERDFGRQTSEEDDEEEGQIVSEGEIEPAPRSSRAAPHRQHKRSASPSPSPSREHKRPPRPGIDDRWQVDSPLRDPSPRRLDADRREAEPSRGWRERPRSASRDGRDWRHRQDRRRRDDSRDVPRHSRHSELDRPAARHAPRESRAEELWRRRRDDGRGGDWERGRGGSPREWGREGRAEEPRASSPDPGDEEVAAQLERALEGGGGLDEETRLIEERRRRRQEILARFEGKEGGQDGSRETTARAPPLQPARPCEPSTLHPPRAPPRSTSAEDFAELNPCALARDMAAWEARKGPAASSHSLPASQALSPSQLASGTGEARDADAARRLQAHAAQAETVLAGDEAAMAPAPAPPEEEDDMFAATPPEVRAALAGGAARARLRVAGGAALVDSFDDAEGYYQFQVGEVLAGRYEVSAALGRGVFSSVLRARDLQGGEGAAGGGGEEVAAGDRGEGSAAGGKGDFDGTVAIKVLRANDTMTKAGKMEVAILKKLADADPGGRRHCVRLLGSFDYRAHLCLVFESLDCNLRELTRRYGRGVGLSGQAVRVYAHQLLQALHHLRACGVVHADIKPDNVLVDSRRTTVRLADFGSAMFAGDNPITPYLVSRFYRAPEIVLGLPYDHPLDVWSLGCVLYELLTGRILFPGKTNNEMLKLFMDLKGPFPKKMLRRAEFAARHFEDDPQQSFALVEEDAVTGRPKRTLVSNPRVRRDAAALLQDQMPDRRKLAQFADLLERMLVLDPDRRITPREALRHPFVKEPFA